MADTTVDVDELWAWVYQPLQDLKQGCQHEPESPWSERVDVFLGQLGLHDPADHPVVQALLLQLGELSDDAERVEFVMTEQVDALIYQLAQELSGPEHGNTADASHDEAGWSAFLAQNGTLWNGGAESWEQFKEWFLYHATEHGLGAPAGAFVNYVDSVPNDERISVFGQYGIAVPRATPDGGDVIPDEATMAAMAELVEEMPEFAEIPEERRRELLAEVLAKRSVPGQAEEAAQ
jgi:hypothetical protein